MGTLSELSFGRHQEPWRTARRSVPATLFADGTAERACYFAVLLIGRVSAAARIAVTDRTGTNLVIATVDS